MKIKGYIKNIYLFFKYKGYKRGGVTIEKLYTMAPDSLLKGKNILVTGGSSGIGYAIAKSCIDRGARVVITGRDENKLRKVKTELGEQCEYIRWDVTKIAELEDVIDKVNGIFHNQIDCLVNNAGSNERREFYENDEHLYDGIMDVHVKAVYFLTQRICKEMEKNKVRGNICTITSHAGEINDFRPYNLAKAATNNFVKGVAKYCIKSGNGIRCNAVAPGPTSTDFCQEFTRVRESGNSYKAGAPDKRYYRAEEIAEVVVFLLSDLSKCVNGQVITCDGGKAIL